MMRRNLVASAVICLLCLAFSYSAFTQQQAPQQREGGQGQAQQRVAPVRPPLFFREAWKHAAGAGEQEVTTDAVSNPNLELKLYGSAKQILVNGNPGDDTNPIRLWTGTCETTCAAALRDKNNYVDLTGLARIIWNVRTSGFHMVHPIIKLADGTWLVGDHAEGSNGVTRDYHVVEFPINEVHWLKLDINKIVSQGEFVDKPDLSKVDEIGFTDLMPGSGHGPGGYTAMAQIEVYGKAVPRDARAQQSQLNTAK